MQTHTSRFDLLGYGADVYARWAVAPNPAETKALVFVHGFGGDSVGTWRDFAGLLPQNSSFSNCDLVFYKYDAVYKRVTESANDFASFLDDLCARNATVFGRSVGGAAARAATAPYSRIVVVAHSTGAVVARRALLDAHYRTLAPGYPGTEAAWLPRTRLVLFAPAHLGTSIPSLLQSGLEGIGITGLPLVGTWLRARMKVLDDLDDRGGSPALASLQSEVRDLIRAGTITPYLQAHKVVWSENDDVVTNGNFPGDAPAVKYPKSHVGVCKPSFSFYAPILEVKSAL